jgi:hypothetical protein
VKMSRRVEARDRIRLNEHERTVEERAGVRVCSESQDSKENASRNWRGFEKSNDLQKWC